MDLPTKNRADKIIDLGVVAESGDLVQDYLEGEQMLFWLRGLLLTVIDYYVLVIVEQVAIDLNENPTAKI